jgi:two-component system LytT family response regulator
MKIPCLIIDDNKNIRSLIKSMLSSEFPQLDLNNEASNCSDAVKLCDQMQPSLVFLDIDLGDQSGFEFLELTSHKNFRLIFISAFDAFAVRAFKVNAVDYILKPFSKEELVNAVHKALDHPYYTDMKDSIQLLVESINGETNRLALPTSQGFEFFDITELIRCESDRNYTVFFFKSIKPVTVSRNIKQYEEILTKKGFVRVHASHIINIRELKAYHKGNGGYVILSDDTKIDISKSRRDEFLMRVKL